MGSSVGPLHRTDVLINTAQTPTARLMDGIDAFP